MDECFHRFTSLRNRVGRGEINAFQAVPQNFTSPSTNDFSHSGVAKNGKLGLIAADGAALPLVDTLHHPGSEHRSSALPRASAVASGAPQSGHKVFKEWTHAPTRQTLPDGAKPGVGPLREAPI
jgi:hypothetical protein